MNRSTLFFFYVMFLDNTSAMQPSLDSLQYLCLTKIIECIRTGIYQKEALIKNNWLPFLGALFDEITKNLHLDTVDAFYYLPLPVHGTPLALTFDHRYLKIKPWLQKGVFIVDRTTNQCIQNNTIEDQFPLDSKNFFLKKYGKKHPCWYDLYVDLPDSCFLSFKGIMRYEFVKLLYNNEQLRYACLKEPYGVIVAHKKNQNRKESVIFLADLRQRMYTYKWFVSAYHDLVTNSDNYFALIGTKQVLLCNINQLSEQNNLSALQHQAKVTTAIFSPCNNYMVTATGKPDHALYLWDIINKQCLKKWQFAPSTIELISWQPHSPSLIVTTDADNVYVLRDANALIKTLPFLRYKKVLQSCFSLLDKIPKIQK